MRVSSVAVAAILAAGPILGCDSDYSLGEETPASLSQTDTPTATPTAVVTPPTMAPPTPTPVPPTPEPGWWKVALRVEPPTVDLGTVQLGCGQEITLDVFNDGTLPLTITNLRLIGLPDAWSLGITTDLTTLEPGGAGHIWIAAETEAVGDDAVEIQINATEGAAALVPVSGAVKDEQVTYTDTYYQEPEYDVDVLWVIDNSGSMGDDQEALAYNFDSFMNYFVPMGIHYNMGVVTTDMGSPTQFGKMQGTYTGGKHYIDWTMRETGEDAFRETIKTLGANGSSSERGLSAMQVALSPEMQTGHNADFLRASASLAVVFVSDEEDQSPGYEVPNYWQEYVDYLVDLKGSLDQVVCSAIVNWADTGGYADVAYATGGVVAEIHTDYAETLQEIGRVSAGFESSFDLTGTPDDSTEVTVTVNGEEVPPGPDTWTYDEETGEVVFADGEEPEDGDRVDISYTGDASCEPSYERPVMSRAP